MLLFIQQLLWARLVLFVFATWVLPLAAGAASSHRAAGYSLTGHVRNKANQPLAGVVISLQGAAAPQAEARVAATNAEGGFFLNCASAEPPVLTLKYAGYQTQTLRIVAKGPVDITLFETGTPLLPQADGIQMVMEATETPEVAAVFPGGITAYQAYMEQNIRYPAAAQAKKIAGVVLVSFTIDEQGRILNPEVARGVAGLNEEAVRLVSAMPWWTPARRAGQPVRSSSFLRVRFEYRAE